MDLSHLEQRIEPLEARRMLSGSSPKVLVLEYHRVLDPSDSSFSDIDVSVTQFTQQVDYLQSQHYHSISLHRYRDWVRNPLAAPLPTKPFIAFFDDGNKTDITTAAPIMQDHGFRGVASVIVKRVGTTYAPFGSADCYASWDDLNLLASSHRSAPGRPAPYGWEIASHSLTHPFLGTRSRGTSTAPYRNTPEDLAYQMGQSKLDIESHLFDDVNANGTRDEGEGSLAPIAFVHPRDDATLRSLAVASEYYDLVFGQSFAASDAHFISRESGLTNGDLVRIQIVHSTPLSTFEKLYDRSTPAGELAYPEAYRDRAGTVVCDGSEGDDRITFGADQKLHINGREPRVIVAINDRSGDSEKSPATITGLDVEAGAGNDSVEVQFPLRSTLHGGEGDDRLIANSTSDLIFGDSGNDTIMAGGGNDEIWGNEGMDLIFGQDGNDTIDGGSQADVIHGGRGDDRILAAGGDDLLYGESGNDTLHGEDGDDTAWGSTGDDSLNGGSGADVLCGNSGVDVAAADVFDVLSSIEELLGTP